MTDTPEAVNNYEEQFAHRFSSEDNEYQEYLSRPADPPPVVEDWRGRGAGQSRGRDNRFQGRRGWGGGGGRGWGGDRGWGGEHHGQQQWQDRERSRHSGYRSGYQSGRPSYNQGYNSYSQRPHQDRY